MFGVSNPVHHSFIWLLLLLLLVAAVAIIKPTEAQWSQYGFDSVHSNQSPYNNYHSTSHSNNVEGICTLWTSDAIPYHRSMSSLVFPVLQTSNHMIVYKNVVVDAERGTLLMRWDLAKYGYVVAITETTSSSAPLAEISSAQQQRQQLLVTISPSPDTSSLAVSAHVLPEDRSEFRNGLQKLWNNDVLRFTEQHEIIVDSNYSHHLFIFSVDRYALHLTALDIDTGSFQWDAIYMGNGIGGVLASNGYVYLLTNSENSTMNTLVCLDGTEGHEIWKRPVHHMRRLFTLIESEGLLIGSAFNELNETYYTIAVDIEDGTELWNHKIFFDRLSPNSPILNIAQANRTTENCQGGIQMLVSRSDGLYTLCTTRNETLGNGTYWLDSISRKYHVNSMNVLSLGDAEKNVISIVSNTAYFHKILFHSTTHQSPSHCDLTYHRWNSPIQGGGEYRNIFVAAEGIDVSEFRLVSMQPQNCKIFPSCPYFELITKKRIAAGTIVLITVNACCFCVCVLCCCYCCKACNPQKSAENACFNCTYCCDMSQFVAHLCEGMARCSDNCCCCCLCLTSTSQYSNFDSYPKNYESEFRYQLYTNATEEDDYVFIHNTNNSGTGADMDEDSNKEYFASE